jgi:tight adherence protein C
MPIILSHPVVTLVCGVGAVVLALCFAATAFDPYWATLRRRVRAMSEAADSPEDDGPPVSSLLRRLVDGAVDRDYDRKYIVAQFVRAGVYRSTAVGWYFGSKLALAVVPLVLGLAAYALGLVTWDAAVIGGLLAASLGSFTPNLWLARAIERRRRSLRNALPDLLDLMIVCLEGGMSLPESLSRVADELRIVHPDLATELGMVQRDVELGSTIDQALRRFADRCEFDGVRTLSTFVREAQRFGTQLTEALRGHADLLRAQREQCAEEMAQKASVKILLPTLLFILPAVFVVLAGPAIIQIQEAFARR